MNIAQYIDHTLLRPDATVEYIVKLCEEARENDFYSVCVNPIWVPLCKEKLFFNPSNVKVCSVVSFPLGASLSNMKAEEAHWSVYEGADEIDMVMNIGALKGNDWLLCGQDIETVRKMVPHTILKVIIETCLLTEKEKVAACQIAENFGANFVKTSTGFFPGGATVQDVALMYQTVRGRIGIKASGGIRTYETAKAMIEAGASRLGCSNSVAIVREAKESEKK